jgi:hypothetical protein
MHEMPCQERRTAETTVWWSFVLIVGFTAGCGESATYPVTGQVVFEDGTPLSTGGIVLTQSTTAEGLGQNARGEIRTDGTFRLTTFKTDDGAVPGKHRVLVRAQRDQDDYIKRGIIPRPVIDPRFESYQTSELEMNVKKASNEVTLVVERPK